MIETLTRAQSLRLIRGRRARNWAIMAALVCLAALFYALAFVKLGHH